MIRPIEGRKHMMTTAIRPDATSTIQASVAWIQNSTGNRMISVIRIQERAQQLSGDELAHADATCEDSDTSSDRPGLRS